MTTIINDIKYSLRQLIKSPVFTTVAVITLSLGIGATTSIFPSDTQTKKFINLTGLGPYYQPSYSQAP